MNHWPFIIAAYAVTALVAIIEIVAVVLRNRAARGQAMLDETTRR